MASVVTEPGEQDDEKQQMNLDHYGLTVNVNDENALKIEIKDSKTKRAFANSFTKEDLNGMYLNQPMDRIKSMITMAKKGSDKTLSFHIGFLDSNSKYQNKNELKCNYSKGDLLYIIVSIEQSYFHSEYPFGLKEQERSEMDIMNDIINDVRNENESLKQGLQLAKSKIVELETKIAALDDEKKENSKNAIQTGIGVWRSSKKANNNSFQWDIIQMEQSLPGMIEQNKEQTQFKVKMKGMYKIIFDSSWSGSHGCTNDWQELRKNGTPVCKKYGHGKCSMTYVNKLAIGDEISLYCNCIGHNYDQIYNSIIIEKIGYH